MGEDRQEACTYDDERIPKEITAGDFFELLWKSQETFCARHDLRNADRCHRFVIPADYPQCPLRYAAGADVQDLLCGHGRSGLLLCAAFVPAVRHSVLWTYLWYPGGGRYPQRFVHPYAGDEL